MHDPARQDAQEATGPLARTGVIGDRHSAALVQDGDVVWWCPTRFDEQSVCAAILDDDIGGHFRLVPADGTLDHARYDGDTNVLCTEWHTPTGRLVVHDLMPLSDEGAPPCPPGSILRIARCIEGRVQVRLAFAPRPTYGAETPDIHVDGSSATLRSASTTLFLEATRPIDTDGRACSGSWDLVAGERVSVLAGAGDAPPLADEDAQRWLDTTRDHWAAWIDKCAYDGPYREAVRRSALALDLLSYAPTGGLVAAVTTSIPEWPGGTRTWDYRYVWIRDAAFAVDAFKDVGHEERALRLAGWLHKVLSQDQEDLRILYTVDGQRAPAERTLDHLAGHGGARPVRVGNAAAKQFQLDVYGELVECLHLCRLLAQDGHEQEDWPDVRRVIEATRERWHQADRGIWEMRTPPRHHVLSKALAWVALDRGVQAVRDLGVEGPAAAWQEAAEAIRQDVFEHGFDAKRNTFLQAYGEPELDASNLLLPILGFIEPKDPRMAGTVDAIIEGLQEDGLVHRYRTDDGAGPQAPFAACSFWLVEVLAMMGREEAAHALMERLLRLATPFGLYAQNIDRDGRHLGNFPQGLTHIALISAATALGRVGSHRRLVSPHRAHLRGWATGAG